MATQIKLKRFSATSSEVLLDEGLGFHEDPTYCGFDMGADKPHFIFEKVITNLPDRWLSIAI